MFRRLPGARWPGRAFAAAAAAGAASWAYQRAGDRRDRRRFPPPGRLVAVDGTSQHLWTAGEGSPPVVVVPCLGGAAIEWADMQRKLQDTSTVVLYDRAELGWSQAWGRSRTVGAMADELYDLLRASGVTGPYVLVGHSIGGLVARLYAIRHPDEVSGMVLVDSSHERMYDRFAEADPPRGLRPRRTDALKVRLRWLGARRLAYDLGLRPSIRETEERNVPADLVDTAVALELGSRKRRGDAGELAHLSRGLDEMAPEARHLGNLPLAVITAGAGDTIRQKFHRVWLELQADLVAQSHQARQVMAEHTDHHVHRDDPDLVTTVIRQIVDEVRGPSRAPPRDV